MISVWEAVVELPEFVPNDLRGCLGRRSPVGPSFFGKRKISNGIQTARSVLENLQQLTVVHCQRLTDVRREFVLGFFGQVSVWKGVDFIVEAVKLAQQSCSQIRLGGCNYKDPVGFR